MTKVSPQESRTGARTPSPSGPGTEAAAPGAVSGADVWPGRAADLALHFLLPLAVFFPLVFSTGYGLLVHKRRRLFSTIQGKLAEIERLNRRPAGVKP